MSVSSAPLSNSGRLHPVALVHQRRKVSETNPSRYYEEQKMEEQHNLGMVASPTPQWGEALHSSGLVRKQVNIIEVGIYFLFPHGGR